MAPRLDSSSVTGHGPAPPDRARLWPRWTEWTEPLQIVADPVAVELEAALAMRRSGADPKALRRALRRIEELLDE